MERKKTSDLQKQMSQRSNMQSYDMEELEDQSCPNDFESERPRTFSTLSKGSSNFQGPQFEQYNLGQRNPAYGQGDLQTKNPQLDSFLNSKRIQDIKTQEPEYIDYEKRDKLKSAERSSSINYDILPGQFVPEPDEEAEEMSAPVKLYVNKYKLCFDGVVITTFYVLAFIFYIVIRSKYSLDIGTSYKSYAIIMLIMEALGGTSVILFGICSMFKPLGNRIQWSTKDPPLTTERMYHIRVLIPAYRESLEIVSHTVMASYYAPVPQNCKKTIYLLDDGNSAEKEAWVKQLNTPTIVYVAGRQKKYVEMRDRHGNPILDKEGKPKKAYAESNGKAENINNALKNYIYVGMKPDQIPLREILCVMDADMIASRPFFMKLVPLLDGGIDIGMILSPQKFHNVPKYQDIFNHSNIHFWEYMLPGFDAMQIIYCTGSNFLMRSRALASCGWFPTTSVTEDYVLGMKMTAKSWKFRYVDEYLATGEAPDNLGQTLQQRSRWTKGPFQILFRFRPVTFYSKDLQEEVTFEAESPFTIPGLTPFQRLMYFQCHWSYIVTVINQMFFLVVPFIAVWVGIFPLNINFYVAIGMTVYYAAQIIIRYFFRGWHTVLPIFFANISGWTLSMCYMKAMFNGSYASITGKVKTFKATSKGTSINKVHGLKKIWLKFITNLRHIWLQLLILIILVLTIAFGGVWIAFAQIKERASSEAQYQIQLITSYQEITIALVWGIFNAVPYWLLIHYSFFGEGKILLMISFLTIFSQIAIYLAIIALLWVLLPRDLRYPEVLNYSMDFFMAQRSGLLSGNPIQTNITWRGDSGLADSITFNDIGFDLRGGLYNGGLAGHAKSTLPLAFVTSILAWSLDKFNPSFQNAGQSLGSDTLQWNLDYLKKAMINIDTNQDLNTIITQVGSRSRESSLVTWGRPEDMRYLRPVYFETLESGGMDVAAQTAAAFASASVYYFNRQPQSAVLYRQYARKAYQYAQRTINLPLYSDGNAPEIIYKQNTRFDDMLWAAAWMWKASKIANDQNATSFYLSEISNLYGAFKQREEDLRYYPYNVKYVFTYDQLFYATAVMLGTDTEFKFDNKDDLRNEFYRQTNELVSKLICDETNFLITDKFKVFNNNSDTNMNCSKSIAQFRFSDNDCVLAQPMDNRKLGSLANNAFLVFMLIKTDPNMRDNKGIFYHCWAETYVKALLGTNNFGRTFVGGYDYPEPITADKPTKLQSRQWHRAASCPQGEICDLLNYYNASSNPNTLYGALSFQFDNMDDHTHIGNLVSIENNIGLTAAMAGIISSPYNQNQCWRVQSQRIRRDPVCGNFGFKDLQFETVDVNKLNTTNV